MLLPLREPTTSPALERITNIAGWLLDYVADWSGADFRKRDFHSSLKKAGLWYLVGSRSAIADHIPTLLALDKKKRESLRDAFYKDISFYKHLDNPEYAFSFPSLPDDIREIGGAFLLLFYKRLTKDGFRDGPEEKATFTLARKDIESGYRMANGHRTANNEIFQLCPACLGLLEDRTAKTSLVDCEHFFPKSLYPPLAVHPNNLVFVCKACNDYHNDDDPMRHSPIEKLEPGALRKTFIPYKRSGLADKKLESSQSDEIKLEFDRINPKQRIVIFVGNGNNAFTHDRAKNLDRIYGISERWGNLIPGTYEILRESIRIRITSRGEVLNKQTIEAQLREEFTMESNFIHHIERAYLRSQYIQWIIQNYLDSLISELTI